MPIFLITLSVGYVVSNVQLLKSEDRDTESPPVPLGLGRQSDRVIVVVLDGVPVRVAYDSAIMPFVSELGGEGASGVLRAPEETTTPAGVRALATGQNPNVADMLDMFRATEYQGWTIFDDIIHRGESVSLSGDKAWTSLLASRDPRSARVRDTETRLYQHADSVLYSAAARIESANPPALTIVHLSETDRLGHLYGTENPEYKKRMRAIDGDLRAFVARVLTDDATLVITADHGNDVFGSHGGEGDVYRNVPIIMLGKGIRKGARIRMDARALPGVLAVLLGTRIPAGMQAAIPAQAFALTDVQGSDLVKANARQLQHLSEIRHLELPASVRNQLREMVESSYGGDADSAVSTGPKLLSAVVFSLDTASPVSAPRILWALVLFVALLTVAFDILWPPNRLVIAPDILLWPVSGLIVVLLIIPRLLIPLLWLTLFVEVALLIRRLILSASRVAVLGLAAAFAVAILPAVRFAYMLQIKAFFHSAVGRSTSAVLTVIAGAFLVALRRNLPVQFRGGSEAYFVALVLLAIAMLSPLSPVPVLLIVITVMAVRASGASWIQVGLIAGLLAAFFFFSERAAFARTGEAPIARYSYVAATCALLVAALMLSAGNQRRWLALAWLSLVPLWPFGYLKITGSNPSFAATALMLIIPLAIAGGVAARHVRIWWVYTPLAMTVLYHLYPNHALFWLALGVHMAILGTVAILPRVRLLQPTVLPLMAVSGLILMSPAGVAPSVALIALGVVAAARIDASRMLTGTAVLLGCVVLVFGRYALVGVFSHGPSLGCTLKCIDEASGFLGFDDTRWTWASGLITLKMLLGSALLISLIHLNRIFSALRHELIAATLLLAFSFVASAALDAALSFGSHGARLGLAMGQAGYATILLLSLLLGDWAERGVQRRRYP